VGLGSPILLCVHCRAVPHASGNAGAWGCVPWSGYNQLDRLGRTCPWAAAARCCVFLSFTYTWFSPPPTERKPPPHPTIFRRPFLRRLPSAGLIWPVSFFNPPGRTPRTTGCLFCCLQRSPTVRYGAAHLHHRHSPTQNCYRRTCPAPLRPRVSRKCSPGQLADSVCAVH